MSIWPGKNEKITSYSNWKISTSKQFLDLLGDFLLQFVIRMFGYQKLLHKSKLTMTKW